MKQSASSSQKKKEKNRIGKTEWMATNKKLLTVNQANIEQGILNIEGKNEAISYRLQQSEEGTSYLSRF